MDLQLQCYLLVAPPASLFFYLTYSLLDLSLSLSVFLPCLSVPPQSVPQCLLFLTQFLSLSLPDSPPSVCLSVSLSIRPSICISLPYMSLHLCSPLSLECHICVLWQPHDSKELKKSSQLFWKSWP